MSQIVISADTATVVMNGRIITDIAAGDYITLTPTNPLTSRANSAQNGVTISKRVDAGVTVMVVRVQKFSNDDVWLNQQINTDIPVVFNGSVKESFVRDGAALKETYDLQVGSITTQPTQTKNNQDVNALMEYTIEFRNIRRNV
ncbi:hypothetical protein RSJ44_003712 [Yersinia enterocolitica]|uniref:DUF3277 family protein n=1 Tax=Yersinia alsatica TaxID=2890317 RepID=A0ABY5UQ41_9GAMM|nr:MULTISPECIES: hypothetical protein [Yersinia]OWF68962.1 hypothetical protein B4901_10325 [Yersinia frederiksenii]EKN3738024.1 hypothetical protein [Yersinia enterocolitica]EKN4841542.1 hypothetical protein [Yersinia enterocolitica]EKN5043321.1 hypothetical protein [Yersinia enterocolitica]EKN5934747.1 hypothetical protein [Yersinia enterocolitica]